MILRKEKDILVEVLFTLLLPHLHLWFHVIYLTNLWKTVLHTFKEFVLFEAVFEELHEEGVYESGSDKSWEVMHVNGSRYASPSTF